MALEHDWKKYPELTNTQMSELQFQSPHHQITEDFTATVSKVHDGDTITLSVDFRNFTFPIRLLDIDAPELNAPRGHDVRDWLINQIEGEMVDIKMDRKQNRDIN